MIIVNTGACARAGKFGISWPLTARARSLAIARSRGENASVARHGARASDAVGLAGALPVRSSDNANEPTRSAPRRHAEVSATHVVEVDDDSGGAEAPHSSALPAETVLPRNCSAHEAAPCDSYM